MINHSQSNDFLLIMQIEKWLLLALFVQDAANSSSYSLTPHPDTVFPLVAYRGRFCMFSSLKLSFLFHLHRMAFLKHSTMTSADSGESFTNQNLLFHLVV